MTLIGENSTTGQFIINNAMHITGNPAFDAPFTLIMVFLLISIVIALMIKVVTHT